jgi:hypothetical protein
MNHFISFERTAKNLDIDLTAVLPPVQPPSPPSSLLSRKSNKIYLDPLSQDQRPKTTMGWLNRRVSNKVGIDPCFMPSLLLPPRLVG